MEVGNITKTQKILYSSPSQSVSAHINPTPRTYHSNFHVHHSFCLVLIILHENVCNILLYEFTMLYKFVWGERERAHMRVCARARAFCLREMDR